MQIIRNNKSSNALVISRGPLFILNYVMPFNQGGDHNSTGEGGVKIVLEYYGNKKNFIASLRNPLNLYPTFIYSRKSRNPLNLYPTFIQWHRSLCEMTNNLGRDLDLLCFGVGHMRGIFNPSITFAPIRRQN